MILICLSRSSLLVKSIPNISKNSVSLTMRYEIFESIEKSITREGAGLYIVVMLCLAAHSMIFLFVSWGISFCKTIMSHTESFSSFFSHVNETELFAQGTTVIMFSHWASTLISAVPVGLR